MDLCIYSCWDLCCLGSSFMAVSQPDPFLMQFKNLVCPISVVYFVTSSAAAETEIGMRKQQ